MSEQPHLTPAGQSGPVPDLAGPADAKVDSDTVYSEDGRILGYTQLPRTDSPIWISSPVEIAAGKPPYVPVVRPVLAATNIPAAIEEPAQETTGVATDGSGKTGRPAALDIYKQREICAMLANGCSRAQAARYVGCSRRTILRTARRDPRFARALELAEVRSEVAQLDHVRSAGAHSWRAAAWLLERFDPDRFSRNQKDVYTRPQVLRVLQIVCNDLIRSAAEENNRPRLHARAGELIGELDYPGGIQRRLRDDAKDDQ